MHELIPSVDNVEHVVDSFEAKGFPARKPTMGHLWFLCYLCWFYLLIPLCGILSAMTARHRAGFRRLLASFWFASLVVAYTAATM